MPVFVVRFRVQFGFWEELKIKCSVLEHEPRVSSVGSRFEISRGWESSRFRIFVFVPSLHSMDGVSPVDVSIDDFVRTSDEYKHEHLLVCM